MPRKKKVKKPQVRAVRHTEYERTLGDWTYTCVADKIVGKKPASAGQ